MDLILQLNGFVQHRYYGESLPFGNRSVDYTERLGYLTSTQALADYAILINSLKQNLSAVDSPVVVFGGSYGGSKSIISLTTRLLNQLWAF
jgi:lysosomal Pro-X carboxypeptidase